MHADYRKKYMARGDIRGVLVIFVVSNATVNDCTQAFSTYTYLEPKRKRKNGCKHGRTRNAWCESKVTDYVIKLLSKTKKTENA